MKQTFETSDDLSLYKSKFYTGFGFGFYEEKKINNKIMKQTFEIPKGCNRVTIEQRNDKIIIDFKLDYQKDVLFINEASNMMDSFEHLIPIIKKWREEKTHKNSVLKPEFKDGDIIYVTCSKIFIVKDFEKGSFHAFLDTNYDDIVLNDFLCPKFGGFKCRIASLDEINKIKQSLYKVGKIWNAEKKCIEDLKPKRWRAESNKYYWYLDNFMRTSKDSEQFVTCDSVRYDLGNYFKTEEQARNAAEKMKELLKQINP